MGGDEKLTFKFVWPCVLHGEVKKQSDAKTDK